MTISFNAENPPRWCLSAVMLLAAVLRLWRLDHGGYGNQYYAAGVRSMVESWHNFFFNAFDPQGFVSLDKPPVAFWIQAISARLFGFDGISILVPQALEGTAVVLLLYLLIGRVFGRWTGLLAAMFLAITPIDVAVDRSNNTDTCLVLVLMLAAWALIHAIRVGSRLWLLGAAALLGLAFNVKMMAAFIVVPAFMLAYFLCAQVSRSRRLADLAIAGIVTIVLSSLWIAAFDLTPKDERPFAGSSTDNTMLELVMGHNGLQRFLSHGDAHAASNGAAVEAAQQAFGTPIASVPPGPLRLADPRLADQVAWLLPIALLGAGMAGARAWRESRLRQAPDWIIWVGWAATYAAVYSSLTRLSPYYLVTLGPPLAALAAIGVKELWLLSKTPARRWLSIPATLLLTAAWQAFIEHGYLQSLADAQTADLAGPEEWSFGLSLVALAGTALALVGLAVVRWAKDIGRPATACFGIAVAVLLVNPFAWSVTAALAGNLTRPLANPAVLDHTAATSGGFRGGGRGLQDSQKLVAFLSANRKDERYLLATLSARQAAPIIIQTGEPVAALGGFSGADPIVTPDILAGMVEAGQLRYVLLSGQGNGSQRYAAAFPGAREQEAALSGWIREHATLVDPTLWRGAQPIRSPDGPVSVRRRNRAQGQQAELYDLKPTGTENPPLTE
jgi:4-amino-4-deoxy-L-arabinose transferase-like glycosyltransferase